jgi:hypothetical protein
MADDLVQSGNGAFVNRRTGLPVSFMGVAQSTNARPAGAAEFPQGIRTRHDPHVLTSSPFGGIEGELLDTAASAMWRDGSTTESFANGLYRIQLPDGVSSSCGYTMTVPEWWYADGRRWNVALDFINDAAGAGNVRMQCRIREIDLVTEGPASGGVLAVDATATWAAPGAGLITTAVVCGDDPIFLPWSGAGEFDPTPGNAASIYAIEIIRLGADGADTLAGSIGIVDVAWGPVPA